MISGNSQFRVDMPCTDHLREINQRCFARLLVDEDVKLVEITVHQTTVRQTEKQSHKCGVELGRGIDLAYCSAGISA